MMQFLTVLNSILFVIAAWANVVAARRKSARRPLRIVAALISVYVASVYGLGALGVLPLDQIPNFMRGMLAVIGIYIIAEAVNG